MTVALQQLPDKDSCFVQISTKNDIGLQVIHSAPSIPAVQPPMYEECSVTDNELMETHLNTYTVIASMSPMSSMSSLSYGPRLSNEE